MSIVYWCKVNQDEPYHFESLLNLEEKEKVSRLWANQDKYQKAAAYALTRLILARVVSKSPESLVFERTKRGKPFLKNGPKFSISHCPSYFACGIDTEDIGVDVEDPLRKAPEKIELVAKTFFSSKEQEMLSKSGFSRKLFYEIWTLKEAFTKAVGVGLDGDLSFSIFPTDKDVYCSEIGWFTRLVNVEDHFLAVVSRSSAQIEKTSIREEFQRYLK